MNLAVSRAGTRRAPRQLMKHMQARASSDVGTLLINDHARLEKLFAALVIAFRAGDRERCAALWNACDSSLEAHMAAEEQLILPEFAKREPVEAAAVAREHAAIRSALSELGIGVDLHCTNAEAVERFTRVLKKHAEREERRMYPWAREGLQHGAQAKLRERLGAAVRRLVARQP